MQLCPAGPAQEWLSRASEAFERERLYLVRVTSAVGPLPSTPGAAETESSLSAARHALETLANSERKGCALGAATALVGDWWPIRRLLDRAATRAGLECPAPSLPDEASVVAVIGDACGDSSSDRALAFGGEQLLLQHRALFDLLEAQGLGTRRFLRAVLAGPPADQKLSTGFLGRRKKIAGRISRGLIHQNVLRNFGSRAWESRRVKPAGFTLSGPLNFADQAASGSFSTFAASFAWAETGCIRMSAIVARRSGNSRREASTTAPSAK